MIIQFKFNNTSVALAFNDSDFYTIQKIMDFLSDEEKLSSLLFQQPEFERQNEANIKQALANKNYTLNVNLIRQLQQQENIIAFKKLINLSSLRLLKVSTILNDEVISQICSNLKNSQVETLILKDTQCSIKGFAIIMANLPSKLKKLSLVNCLPLISWETPLTQAINNAENLKTVQIKMTERQSEQRWSITQRKVDNLKKNCNTADIILIDTYSITDQAVTNINTKKL